MMFIAKHTIETRASAQAIWDIWQDVEHWNRWDSATEQSLLNGPFAQGTSGSWKATEGPLLAMRVTHVEPLKASVIEFKMFLARTVVFHYLHESAGKTYVTERIEIKGPLAFLYAYHSRSMIEQNLLYGLRALVNAAEALSKTDK